MLVKTQPSGELSTDEPLPCWGITDCLRDLGRPETKTHKHAQWQNTVFYPTRLSSAVVHFETRG